MPMYWKRSVMRTMMTLTQDPAGAVGPFRNAKLGLLSANITITPDTLFTDLTQPTATTGYAISAAITWVPPSTPGNNECEGFVGDLKTFTRTDATQPDAQIFGCILLDNAGTDWLAVQLFDTPVLWSAVVASLFVVPQLSIPSTFDTPFGIL